MEYHILNGDSLADHLKQSGIRGEFLVCRECLIDGPLQGDNLPDFFTTRANYISGTYQEISGNYLKKVVPEFEKIMSIPAHSKICLWFENDLFCQANMWFVLSLLFKKHLNNKIFRIFPTIDSPSDLWKGFGSSTAEMFDQSYSNKVSFESTDLALGNELWNAYKKNDFNMLIKLSMHESLCFQHLEQVCQAHIDRFPSSGPGRPEKTIKEIYEAGTKNFNNLFSEFSSREGIYGFGDLQVKLMFDSLKT